MPTERPLKGLDAVNRRGVTCSCQAALGLAVRLACLAAVLLGALAPTGRARAAESGYELVPPEQVGHQQQVRVEVRIEGNLKLNADGKAVRTIPLTVTAHMAYAEKVLEIPEGDRGTRRSVRSYDRAEAAMRIGDMALDSQLREDRQLIAVAWDGTARPILFSPAGPLTREELDLIDIQANSLCLGALAPAERVDVGQSWDPPATAVVALLGLDAVVESDVRGKLLNVNGHLATAQLAGTVDGIVGGVATKVRLRGQWDYDRDRKLVTRVKFSIAEDRAIGHSEPGFETQSHIQLALQPLQEFPLDEESLKQLGLLPSESSQWLRFASDLAGVGFLHDRHWRVMADSLDGVILRRVDQGELIAQCNLIPLRKLPAGQKLSLEQFQADVKQTLAERFGNFVEASQSDEQGLRMLRVVTSGTVSEVPIRWIYYHVSDTEGRRASMVFTLEESLAEKFGASDMPIVRSLEFFPGKAARAVKQASEQKERSGG